MAVLSLWWESQTLKDSLNIETGPKWHFKNTTFQYHNYRETSNISRTLVGNKIVDNSDVVGASPIGAAPTTSSFST